jgi:hypothetical protein
VILPVISGLVGGLIFPLANKIYLGDTPQGSAHIASGTLYGVDLVGSGLGAMLVSAVLIPIVGVYQTLAIIILLNLTILGTLKPATLNP